METGANAAASRKSTETKEMEKFTHLEALLFAAVLENCVDQLSILGYIMPFSYEGQTDIRHTGSHEIKEIKEAQKELDKELMSAREGTGETVTATSPKSVEHKQQLEKTEDRKSTHRLSNRAMKHSALSAENLRKIQADRQYANDVITVTMKNMQEMGTFNSLTEANEREKEKKSKFHDILIREEEGKNEIKSLEEQLQNVKKETEIELQEDEYINEVCWGNVLNIYRHLLVHVSTGEMHTLLLQLLGLENRDAVIAFLKDQLLEVKAKTNMESCYMKKSTDLQVHQTQKKCSNAENALDEEIQKLKRRNDEEIRVHVEIDNFLRRLNKKVEEKLEHWVDKFENDTDAKEEELDALKALKANNLEMLRQIAMECQMFEETIIRDRAEREAEKQRRERDALELKSILKLQAWWRGIMVRRNLGPYQNLKKNLQRQLSKQEEKGKAAKYTTKKKK